MACHCHGKSAHAERRVRPDDQCTTCAYKHIRLAVGAWGEFTYEIDNREYVATQLRLTIEHLKRDHIPTAIKCRDLAIIIEEARDPDTGAVVNTLRELTAEIRDLYLADHPDIPARLSTLSSATS